MPSLHTARLYQASEAIEHSLIVQTIIVPPFKLSSMQVVRPVLDRGPSHRFTLQTTRRLRTMLPETPNSLREPNGAPSTSPPHSRPDRGLTCSGMQCLGDLDLFQPMTQSSVLRSPLDITQSPNPTMARVQQPWLLRPHQCPGTIASEGAILSNLTSDPSRQDLTEITNQAVMESARTAGPTQVSTGSSSGVKPLTPSGELHHDPDDNAQYLMDDIHIMDTDGATGGE